MPLPRYNSSKKCENTVSSSNTDKSVWAVLPLKGLKGAKDRLSNILNPEERAALVTAMAQDVLSALTSSTSLAGVLVISDANNIKELVKEYSVELIPEGEAKGLNGAISHAATILANRGVNAMMVIHGDIPLIKPQDINAIIDASLLAPSVTIAPCSHKDGTNVMVCSPPDVISFQYGKNSFSKHMKATADIGHEAKEISNNRLALDIDTGEDLQTLRDHLNEGEVGEKTTAFLRDADLSNLLK